LGNLELRRGNFARALELLELSFEIYVSGDPDNRAEMIYSLGSAHRGLGDYVQAQHHQRNALQIMEHCGALFGECDVRIELAITLHLAGEEDEAKEHIDKALHIADRLHLLPQRAKALDVLATITDDETLRAEATALYEQLGLPWSPMTPTLEE
jgi:tetratricopeptide (TPR) repeat protein